MTLVETITIIEILAATYPNAKAFSDEAACEKTARIWASLLANIHPRLATVAVKKHCMTSRFPPTVAEIREAAAEINQPAIQETAADAWGCVLKAVRRFGWYREEDAVASMNEQTKAVVKAIGWKAICECEEPDVIRGQFRMAYETMSKRTRESAVLPEQFKQTMAEIAGGALRLIE